jgi:hypothetical protein
MQENQLFEYAIIRVVPRVEREEFLNVGVMLFCKKTAFLHMLYTVDEKRLQALYGDIDLEDIKTNLHALEQICMGKAPASPIAALDTAGRFRWLTARRSTVVQMSAVHPGLCANPAETLQRLFQQILS